jgi:Chaperone of endosialidase
MTSQPLIRTEYWNTSTGTVRTGDTAHGESLTDIESYLLPLAQMQASGFYTWGVVEGLTVSAVTGQAGLTISPGVALDRAGHLIALADGGSAVVDPVPDLTQTQNVAVVLVTSGGVTLSTAGQSGACLLTLTWLEVVRDSEAGSAPVLLHAPWLRLAAVAGFADDGSQVILAQVTLDSDGLVTALTAGAQADSTAAPGRRGPFTQVAGVTFSSAGLATTAAGLSVADAAAGQLIASDASTLRLAVSDPAGVLELAAGQGPGSGINVTADQLSVQAASDAQDSHGIQLDATTSTVTAGTLKLGGAQSGVSLGTGPAAGTAAVTADRLTIRASDGTDRISLDGSTSTVSTGSVQVGSAVTMTAGSGGVLALSATAEPAQLGIGTPTPRNAIGIRGITGTEELISFEDAGGVTRWHVNQKAGGQPGLNFAETGVADGRLFLQPGGKVGIGTNAPAFTLDVHGTVCAQQFCNPSDLRLKSDVTPLSDVLDRLAGVRAVRYRPAQAIGASQRQIGVLAQEVQEAFPELVLEMGPDGWKAVDYAGLSGVLLGAVHELLATTSALADRLTELEQQMAARPAGPPAGPGSRP